MSFKIFLIFFFLLPLINGKNILFFSAISTKSENHVFSPIVKALHDNGHKMTFITTVNFPTFPKEIKQFNLFSYKEIFSEYSNLNPSDLKGAAASSFNRVTFDYTFLLNYCHKFFQNEDFLRLMSQPYDLILISGFANDCFYGLLDKIGSSYIFVKTMAASNFITTRLGNYLPSSFVVNPFLTLPKNMSFMDRLVNTVSDWTMTYFQNYVFMKDSENVYKKYLGKDSKSAYDFAKNASLLLMNSHYLINGPRPFLPDLIEIGGISVSVEEKPLPKDIQDFIDGASEENGFIYFSLGTISDSSKLGPVTIDKLVNVFSRLPQRVIWKFEDADKMKNKNIKNILFKDWLPQTSILAHSKIRLFITHGGLLSTHEAAWSGVPLLGTPIFFDQEVNLLNAEEIGLAKIYDFETVTEKELEDLIKSIIENKKIGERAKEISRIYQDRMENPLEKAIFWIEYVMRHNGAIHLRSSTARELSFFQYFSFDVISLILLIIIAIFYILKKILIFILRICFQTKKAKSE